MDTYTLKEKAEYWEEVAPNGGFNLHRDLEFKWPSVYGARRRIGQSIPACIVAPRAWIQSTLAESL